MSKLTSFNFTKRRRDDDDPDDPEPQQNNPKRSSNEQHSSTKQTATSVSGFFPAIPSTSSQLPNHSHVLGNHSDQSDIRNNSSKSVLWTYFTRAARCKTCNVLVHDTTETALKEHLSNHEECGKQNKSINVKDVRPWEYFLQVGICNACKKVFSTPTGTTSTLIRHMDQHPLMKREYLEANQSLQAQKSVVKNICRQQTLGAMLNPSLPHNNNSARSKAITKQIGVMIAKDYQPFSVVCDKGFRDLVHLLEPKYSMPSRSTFSRSVIPNLYEDTRRKVEETLTADFTKGVESVSVTVDCWTSASQDPYVSLTAHYISPEMKLVNQTLECSFFPGSHSGLNIKTKLEDMFCRWKIPSSVPIFVVTDNAKNMVAAIQNSQWTHISCAAHSLQLAVHDAHNTQQSSLSSVLKKAKSIVGHYNSSTQALARLHTFQEQLNLPCKKLKTMVATRWNSEYDMLASLVEQRAAVSAELAKSGKVECLNLKEWDTAIGLVEILRPIEEATKELCREDNPTLSMMIPIVSSILSTLQDLTTPERSGFGVVYGKNLFKAIMCRFPSYRTNKHYLPAMLLDPRFKGLILDEHELQHGKSMVLQELKAHVGNITPPESPLPKVCLLPEAQPYSIWKAFDKSVTSSSTSACSSNTLEQEVEKYFKIPTVNRTENPCMWWTVNKDTFPNLYAAARKFLAIPATSASSERLFSKAGSVVTSRRGSLSSAHVERLVFLHDNL